MTTKKKATEKVATEKVAALLQQSPGGMARDEDVNVSALVRDLGAMIDEARKQVATGGSAHVYRAISTTASWVTQRDACAADGTNAYLAIPNDLAELQGIATLSAVELTWVGIHDRNNENAFETVRGDTATYLPWRQNEPNNQGEQDCVSAIMSSSRIQTDPCNDTKVAVCECEP